MHAVSFGFEVVARDLQFLYQLLNIFDGGCCSSEDVVAKSGCTGRSVAAYDGTNVAFQRVSNADNFNSAFIVFSLRRSRGEGPILSYQGKQIVAGGRQENPKRRGDESAGAWGL